MSTATQYLPPQFQSDSPELAALLLREHPFANLVSTGADGLPFLSHIPLHLQTSGDGTAKDMTEWRLLGHVAKANPHAALLEAGAPTVVSFMGPQAYMSPTVYAEVRNVPTWSYVSLQAVVGVQILGESAAKDALLKCLIGDHEPEYAAVWRGLDDAYQQALLRNIVAFELRMSSIQFKIKLNQHRPAAHAAMHARYAGGNAQEQALALWMQRLGLIDSIKV